MTVVLRLEFAFERLDFDDELKLSDLRRSEGNADGLRVLIFRDGRFDLSQHLRLVLFAQHNRHVASLEAGGR